MKGVETAYLKSKSDQADDLHPGACAPYFEKFQKMLFQSFRHFEIIFFMYILCTYLCRFRHKKTAMCDLHINVIPIFVNSVNSAQPIIIVSFEHFVIFV
jgi:hypothetical protein